MRDIIKKIYLFHDEEKPLMKEKKNESFEKRLEKIKKKLYLKVI